MTPTAAAQTSAANDVTPDSTHTVGGRCVVGTTRGKVLSVTAAAHPGKRTGSKSSG